MSDEPSAGSGGTVHEVEFAVRDPSYPFVYASEREDCLLELAEMVPRSGATYAEFFNVRGGDVEAVAALSSDHDRSEATVLAEYDDGGLLEFRVDGNCPARSLAERGALPREVRAAAGDGRIVTEIPADEDSAAVVEAFLAEYPGAELVAKRARNSISPMFSDSSFDQVVSSALTDRQREVVEAAYEAGYYEWPRETTGADVAASLDISSATFSEHVHAGERKLLAELFDGEG